MKNFLKIGLLFGLLRWLLFGAFVSNGYKLQATAVDQGGNKGYPRWRLYANPLIIATIPATLFESLAAKIITDYAKLTNAKLIDYSLNSLYTENIPPYIGAIGSEIEEAATLTCRIDTTGTTGSGEIKFATMHILAPKQSLFLGAPGTGPQYNIVDNNNADIEAYLGNFTYSAVAPYGAVSDLEPLLDPTDPTNWNGKRTHKGSSKG